jgi:DNA-binding beta-propeller fold protein YncE
MIASQRQYYMVFFLLCCLIGGIATTVFIKRQQPIHPRLSVLHHSSGWYHSTTSSPLSHYKNAPVLVHFYNPSDANAQHAIDILNQASTTINPYCNQVGIYCPTHDYDTTPQGITAFIAEHQPSFPFVIDQDGSLQKHFATTSLPCSLFFLPEKKEPILFDRLTDYNTIEQRVLAHMTSLPQHKPEKLTPAINQPEQTLLFPVKIDYIKSYNNEPALAIADSGHHRILIVRTDGTIIDQIGTGQQGFADGNFEQVSFNRPHGVLYDDVSHRLFVADRYNHALRTVDLKSRTVSTRAGTGEWGHSHMVATGLNPSLTPLSAPYDLSFFIRRDFIVIGQAGTHTTWGYEAFRHRLRPLVGNGLNELKTGKPPYNAIMNPTGICLKRGELLLADAGAHALCSLDGLEVEPLVGAELIHHGFQDGKKDEATLNYPCGIATNQLQVFIADTYNHAIRQYDHSSQILSTVCGTGHPGSSSDNLKTLELNAPKGLVAVADMLYIADTNNHRIVAVNTKEETAHEIRLRTS